MTQQENQVLLDKVWQLAQSECDDTCPPEIVLEKAQELFLQLLVDDQN